MARSSLSAGLFLSLLLAWPAAHAQTINASLTGVISDSSGAAMPGTKVQIINDATNIETVVTTRDDGTFLAPSLPPGLPNTSVNSNQFGKITGQANSPRQLQFGLKLLF